MTTIRTAEELAKQNAAFEALSVPAQRVAIAEDVIAQLNVKKFKASPGEYLGFLGDDDVVSAMWNSQESAQERLCNTEATCTVCAIGAVFTSRIRVGNHINNLTTHGRDMVDKLDGVFSKKELRHMEYAFEGKECDGFYRYDSDLVDQAMAFYSHFTNLPTSERAEARLRALMYGIINTGGEVTYDLTKCHEPVVVKDVQAIRRSFRFRNFLRSLFN